MKTLTMFRASVMSFLVLFSSTITFANSDLINLKTISRDPYYCTEGGTITLSDTRYENVKKIVLSQSGSIDKMGYAIILPTKDYYSGRIHTSMRFPSPEGSDARVGASYADIKIEMEHGGLVLKITPIFTNRDAQYKMTCRNY